MQGELISVNEQQIVRFYQELSVISVPSRTSGYSVNNSYLKVYLTALCSNSEVPCAVEICLLWGTCRPL